MRVRVNGQDREFAESATVADVLAAFGAPTTGVAVALDGDVVPRGAWPDTPLRDGATVEVLTAVQGG
ncbi:sulfur carrier protein [Streptoalloteichus tenebrarius]|uniref:Sulfur carrier protein n=1 Tax=Streptoalloteichus tenebrarius (strain ATCC 17920 / DSM 40477 / JCM 4838 / CBS 697.72 / NBRC 16177 / NCIMB 11028 / NRRL B-12390 / A12253. 1 / ISP 5477) TaxID=1933 RepID=A0ABT1HZ14_STRSD|nr:sulfur carrier protein ThiS [Streptoalloteichus tenebrarius]MCP2260600.1 sulfur carrier protein [Streptoalloteichus tenebrarius]BFF01481.1 sulfur carrier protein ThiS [Streptoalloteichus tenebrarius]